MILTISCREFLAFQLALTHIHEDETAEAVGRNEVWRDFINNF